MANRTGHKAAERTTPERIYLFHENRQRTQRLLQGSRGYKVGVRVIKGQSAVSSQNAILQENDYFRLGIESVNIY